MRNVAVVFGGPSAEHDISRLSGGMVLEQLDRERYHPVPVLLERTGGWVVAERAYPGPLVGAQAMLDAGCEVAFLALHGPFGEDGTIQGFFETISVPYTGSGVEACALARHKTRAKRFLAAHGVPGAPDVTVPPADADRVERELGFPVVIKDPREGSTFGIERAADREEYEAALGRLRAPELLVEKLIRGREFTAAVLENEAGEPEALPLVEIISPDGFFDFEAKYSTEHGAEEICPAVIDEPLAGELRELALRAHRALGLRGFSRSDFLVTAEGAPCFLETNAIPGLAPTSLFPKAVRAAGMELGEFLTRLIENALR